MKEYQSSSYFNLRLWIAANSACSPTFLCKTFASFAFLDLFLALFQIVLTTCKTCVKEKSYLKI